MPCSLREPSAGFGRNSGGLVGFSPLAGILSDSSAESQLSGEKVTNRASFGMEVENDDFFGFVRSGFPFASVYGIDRGLNEDGMTAKSLGRLYRAVGKDHSLNFDGAGEAHLAGEIGIGGNNLCDDFALGLGLILLATR